MPAIVDASVPADFGQLVAMAGKTVTEQKAELPPIRAAALDESAMAFGAQGGLAYRTSQIAAELKRMERDLDKAFDFSAMIIGGNVLSPVVVSAQDAIKADGDGQTFRVADFMFKIEQPARFVTTAPTWRDYLRFDTGVTPEVPHRSILPQNAAEQAYWNASLKKGWESGVKQADDIFRSGLARLKRDMKGMIGYRMLLSHQMVSAPIVASSEMGVTGDGKQISVRDRVYRITVNPSLETDPKRWKAVASAFSKMASEN
jgi:defect-in-organelle-trafficking protein DotC